MFLLSLALAAEHPVWLALGVEGGAGIGSVPGGGGGVMGLAGVALGGPRSIGLEGRIGEGVYSGATRTVGSVNFDVRWPNAPGAFGYVGFAHRHELGFEAALANPLGAIAATDRGITHRTGFELGMGWDALGPFRKNPTVARFFPTTRLNLAVLPGEAPLAYLTLNLGLGVGIGRPRVKD